MTFFFKFPLNIMIWEISPGLLNFLFFVAWKDSILYQIMLTKYSNVSRLVLCSNLLGLI